MVVRDRHAYAFLALLIIILYADIIFFGRGLYQYDLFSYHLPMKWIVRDTIAHGAAPLWNRYYSGGQPMAANPAYEVFYPPQWLIFLPSFLWGFQVHILAHFIIAAFGMYALLRGFDLRPVSATFGAVVFVLSGPYLSLVTKLPLLFSLSLMPLALHCARQFIDQRSVTTFVPAALVLALQMIIGEPTVALQTWLLLFGYTVWRRRWRNDVPRLAALAAVAVLLAAIQLLPALDFTRDSVRSEPFEFRVVSNWSMPLARPVEMALASVFRNLVTATGAPAITTMYPFRSDAFILEMYLGVATVLLGIAGFLAGSRGALTAGVAAFLSYVAAAGEHTPLLKLLYDAHLLRSVRYPEKFILAGAFVLIVWAAVLFDRILDGDRALLRTTLVVAAVWLALVAVAFLSSATSRGYAGLQVVRAAVTVAIFAAARNRSRAPAWPFVAVALIIVDLWWATRFLVPRMPREFFDAPPITRNIAPRTRIYPDAYWQVFMRDPNALSWVSNRTPEVYWWMQRNGLAEHSPARFGFELVLEEDVDRTSLKTTDAFREAMKAARYARPGGDEPFARASGADVRLRFRPAESAADVMTTPVEAEPIAGVPRYGFVDRVQHVGSDSEAAAGLESQRDPRYVAFVPIDSLQPAGGQILDALELPNAARITVRAAGQAFLAMTVTAHRYWSAMIDGRPAPLIPMNIAYQGLVVPAGNHVVEMRYRNPWLAAGAAVTALTLLAVLALLLAGWRKGGGTEPESADVI